MDFNNKPEQGFGGDLSNDNIFDNNQTFDNTNTFNNNQTNGNNTATYSAPTYNAGNSVYNAPNAAPGNGVYTPNPAPVNNAYSGGNSYYSNPTPPGDFDRFNSFGGQKETPVSVGDWMLTYLILMIPCVNIVMIFVWAFSSGTKKSKSNYFKATLLWALIYTVICVLIVVIFGGLGALGASSSYYY